MKEAKIGEKIKDLFLTRKTVSSDKILDLTNPNTLSKLDIDLSDLTDDEKITKYVLPQIIGNIAINKGYTAIKAISAKKNTGVNFIILDKKVLI